MHMLRGNRLHVFCGDEDFASSVVELAERYSVDITTEFIGLGDLPTRCLISPILHACEQRFESVSSPAGAERPGSFNREKGDIHFWRHFVESGAEAYRNLLSIWTSKIPLVSRWVCSSDGAKTDSVAWVDVTVSRFNGSRSGWDFRRQVWPEDRISHYSSPRFYRRKKLPLNASFIAASPRLWPILEASYLEALKNCSADGYAHDEETILSHVMDANPGLFHAMGHPCRGFRRMLIRALSVFKR
jgi:hypothetical protein